MDAQSPVARCAMFCVLPVSRLSTPTTDQPRSSSASDRCDPMNPAAPVMTARGMSRPVSECVAVEPADEGQPHDFQVERDRPVLDVVQVVLDPLLERRVAAPAVDLRPAGDPRLHLVPQHVLRDPVLELLEEIRTLGPWPDDRHVAAEHVPELRQLVDVETPQPLAHGRAPRVVVACPHWSAFVLRPLVHRAELVDLERAAVEAHPLLL